MVLGDLNEIMYHSEKDDGNSDIQNFMQAFRGVIQEYNLSYFGYVGNRYTCHRGRISERLVYALTNMKWNDKFAGVLLENLEYSSRTIHHF